ncbi:MAG TPA: hypothetical protein VFC13_26755 [Actinomycetes bacterium]|nr:hypothetical protein [Actinomycetes bacterium]
MLRGNPTARAVSVLVGPGTGAPAYLTGDGWLPSDLDGNRRPPAGSPNYIVGTQDDEGPYGAPFDAINLFEFSVSWGPSPGATFTGPTQLPVAEFDSDYPCVPPGSRNCIPQPGTSQRIDILSYRQRPTWRLAYRNFGTYESLVTSQSVEARPGIAGMRWYELRRPGDQPLVYQQGTYAPADGVNRWMGSIAQDRKGNMALGYSVSNSTGVFPDIRYTGRLRNDVANQMPPGRGGDRQRRRLPDRPGRPLGRLHLDERRPDRQLPLLVRQPVLPDHLGPRLADPDRRLPDARLHLAAAALVARQLTRHTGGRGRLVAPRRHRRP